VLAVGDAAFQKKCLGKMGDVAKEGRTVLFVSHNMGAVNSLTRECIYLRDGQIIAFDDSRKVVKRYLAETIEQSRESIPEAIDFFQRNFIVDSPVKITKIWVDKGVEDLPVLRMNVPFTIYIQMQVYKEIHGANLTIILKNAYGERITTLFSWDQGFSLFLLPGQHIVAVRIDHLSLTPGRYFVDVGINQSTETVAYNVILDFPIFHIANDGQITHWLERPWGIVYCNNVTWQILES